MFNKIQHPITGKWVNINTPNGSRVLTNYIKQVGGSCGYNPRYTKQQTVHLTPWEMSIEDRISRLEHALYNQRIQRTASPRAASISDAEIVRHMRKSPPSNQRLSRVQLAKLQSEKLQKTEMKNSLKQRGRRGRRGAIISQKM